MKRKKREDRFLYWLAGAVFILCVLSACGVEYKEPVAYERSEIEIASPETEIADSTVSERTVTVEPDHFTEYKESIELGTITEEETNDEGTAYGTYIYESVGAEDSGRDISELSDSGRDISDSGELQDQEDEPSGDGYAGSAEDGDSGADREPVLELNGAEQDDAGADHYTDEDVGADERELRTADTEYADGNDEDSEVGMGEQDGTATEPVIEETPDEGVYSDAETTSAYEESLTYVGAWVVTFYCDCAECVGQYAGMNMTASGREPIPWYTVATGSSYPFGTVLYIDGFGYFEVMDRGVGDGWADIYVSSHGEIPSYGMTTADVYIVG